MMMLVFTFLIVTMLIVSLQPRQSSEASPIIAEPVRVAPAPPAPIPETEAPAEVLTVRAAAPEPAVAPAPLPPKPQSIVVESQVTRADASLLELRQAVSSSQASHLLRQTSTDGTPIDLRQLARTVLGDFGYPVRDGDRLHAMLVGALSDQKSDAYIDALLNTAVARGAFTPPEALTLSTGRLDTQALLRAMLLAVRS